MFLFYFIFLVFFFFFYKSIGSKWVWIPPYIVCCIESQPLWLCKVCQFVFGVGEAHHAECCSRASLTGERQCLCSKQMFPCLLDGKCEARGEQWKTGTFRIDMFNFSHVFFLNQHQSSSCFPPLELELESKVPAVSRILTYHIYRFKAVKPEVACSCVSKLTNWPQVPGEIPDPHTLPC